MNLLILSWPVASQHLLLAYNSKQTTTLMADTTQQETTALSWLLQPSNMFWSHRFNASSPLLSLYCLPLHTWMGQCNWQPQLVLPLLQFIPVFQHPSMELLTLPPVNGM
jgi:hypothetical protein